MALRGGDCPSRRAEEWMVSRRIFRRQVQMTEIDLPNGDPAVTQESVLKSGRLLSDDQ